MIKGNLEIFNIPQPSPWPLLLRFSIFNSLCIGIIWAENLLSVWLVTTFLALSIFLSGIWMSDASWESYSIGLTSLEINLSLKVSMIWFIRREVMFFFSFLSSYIALSLCGEVSSGRVWPPIHIPQMMARSVPLLNTIILLSRGVSLTWAHLSLMSSKRESARIGLLITLILALSFTLLQILEYKEGVFCMNDSVFGSIFYLSTGFHGIHVFVGSSLLLICMIHLWGNNVYTRGNHVFLELRSWYWHFVDVVWLFLFLLMYCQFL